MGYQRVFRRYEVKFIVSRRQRQIIEGAFAGRMQPDEYGRTTICSVYYDTPDKLLVRRSMEGPVYKEKLRVRSYGVASRDSQVFVELKKKYDHMVYKRRADMSAEDAARYMDHNILRGTRTQIVSEIDYFKSCYPELAPSAYISYERAAYCAADDPGFRVTFDENIVWRDTDLNLASGAYGERLLDDEKVLMEVKTSYALPLWLTRVLTENRIYRTPFSKCGNAYRAAMNKSVRRCLSA